MNLLIGSYDSDDEAPPVLKRPETLEPEKAVEEVKVEDGNGTLCKVDEKLAEEPTPLSRMLSLQEEDEEEHHPFCECKDCSMLMLPLGRMRLSCSTPGASWRRISKRKGSASSASCATPCWRQRCGTQRSFK